MEQSLSDLLGDAFSETSVPCLEDGDLDFENLGFDERLEEEKTDDRPTKEDGAVHHETTGETTVSSNRENEETAETVDEELSDVKNDEEDFQGVGISLMAMDETAEEDYTSSSGESEEESSDSRDDKEEEDMGTEETPGDLLRSVQCSDDIYNDNKEDEIFAEGQLLAPGGAESESDEEVSYFGQISERGNEMAIKDDGTKEDEQEQEAQEDSSDSECGEMKIKQMENVLAQCFEQEIESPYREGLAEAALEFPDISVQNLQDRIVEVDSEEYTEKIKDFSGEEHQEAGESFADYPSDFSSCEYVHSEGTNQENDSNTLPCQEKTVTDVTWMEGAEDTNEEGEGYLYSRDLEMDADRLMSVEHVTEYEDGGDADESVSYSSSDDDVQVRTRDEEVSDDMCLQDLESYKKLEDTQLHSESSAAFSRWSISDDHHFTNNRIDFNINLDFDLLKIDTLLSEDLLSTEDTSIAGTPHSDVSPHPAEDINRYSVVHREDSKTTSLSYQGSLDDSFFFNTELEASGVSEQEQLGDDKDQEDRNWEQEQERIKAFYQFYNDNDGENGREERSIKVQFCSDPLSKVILYETDSSDRDSLSSSTDEEEDLSSTETSEEPRELDNTLQMKPAFDPPYAELPESVPENKLSNKKICTEKDKCLGMLKLLLTMGLVILMGLLMFWLATDQADWLSHV